MNTDTLKLDTTPKPAANTEIAELGVASKVIKDLTGNFQWDSIIYDFKRHRVLD